MNKRYFTQITLLFTLGLMVPCEAAVYRQIRKGKAVKKRAQLRVASRKAVPRRAVKKQPVKPAVKKTPKIRPAVRNAARKPATPAQVKPAQQNGVKFIPYQQERAQLMQHFDNKLTFQGMPLKFSYDHVFAGDFYPNGQIGGLHHDWMNHLQKSNQLRFGPIKKRWPSGMYRATIFHQGTPNDKTMYPAEWDRARVMRKVFEAFNNQVPATGVAKGGRTIIEGLTREGIRIRLVIDQNGTVVTFFPVS